MTFRVVRLFEGCQTSVFHLERPAAASYKRRTGREKKQKKNREHPGLRNEEKIVRSLFVMAARLKASAEGRSLEDMADLMWLEHRDAVHLICSGEKSTRFTCC